MNKELLIRAREMLEEVTPLRTDCGEKCGGACCKSDSASEEGMLLFPGEEELYGDCGFAAVRAGVFHGLEETKILVCNGICERGARPLCCRLFPLAPRKLGYGYSVQVDPRAYNMCPIARRGLRGMTGEFRNTCMDVFNLLAGDADYRRVLDAWAELMEEYKNIF